MSDDAGVTEQEPRSLGEALAAGEGGHEGETAAAGVDQEDPTAAAVPGDEAPEQVGTLDDMREFLGATEGEAVEPSVEPTGYDPSLEQSEPQQFPGMTHAPSMTDLREALVTLVANAPPTEDLGPMVEFGGRKVPAAYVRLWQQGWLS